MTPRNPATEIAQHRPHPLNCGFAPDLQPHVWVRDALSFGGSLQHWAHADTILAAEII